VAASQQRKNGRLDRAEGKERKNGKGRNKEKREAINFVNPL